MVVDLSRKKMNIDKVNHQSNCDWTNIDIGDELSIIWHDFRWGGKWWNDDQHG